ncbi:helix-turn-helix domain-containing protein [Haliscomenobacter sp.]|uniref:helix-turn-helix domain-containing protein n=1 Tax=Haliscomenobacter sp. TaxID=2717303 RepID=UPI003593A239
MTPTGQHTHIFENNAAAALLIKPFNQDSFSQIQRQYHYSILWLKKGSATLKTNCNEYELRQETMMFFSPYQPFILSSSAEIVGEFIQFQADFFCIYKHDKETNCNGLLFNNLFNPPFIFIENAGYSNEFLRLLEKIKAEMNTFDSSKQEMLVAYLKIFLIHAARLKKKQEKEHEQQPLVDNHPSVLQTFKELIEAHFREKHSPRDYALMLNITAKTLGRITKMYCNKTLTELISERIIIEAQRELYLTEKSVKQIGAEVGFDDEYHFSRYFKNATGVSPAHFREKLVAFQVII